MDIETFWTEGSEVKLQIDIISESKGTTLKKCTCSKINGAAGSANSFKKSSNQTSLPCNSTFCLFPVIGIMMVFNKLSPIPLQTSLNFPK
jgi:hypothetical protein